MARYCLKNNDNTRYLFYLKKLEDLPNYQSCDTLYIRQLTEKLKVKQMLLKNPESKEALSKLETLLLSFEKSYGEYNPRYFNIFKLTLDLKTLIRGKDDSEVKLMTLKIPEFQKLKNKYEEIDDQLHKAFLNNKADPEFNLYYSE